MKKVLIVILLLMLSNGFCYAQEAVDFNKLTLSQAIDLALFKNADIHSIRLEIEKSKNNIKIEKKLQNPYIQTFFNGGKAATDNPNSMGIMLPIDIAKRGPRKRLAQAQLNLMQKNVAFAEFNLKMDVRQSYVELVTAKSVLSILEDQQKLLQELVDISQKKYDVGVSPEMDVIQAKMALNQLTTQVNTARTYIDVARYNFNKTLDIEDDSLVYDTEEVYLPVKNDFIFMLTPKPKEIMPDFLAISDIAAQKRLDMKIAKQEIEVAQKNLDVVIRQRVPNIEIGGGAMFVPSSLSSTDATTRGGYIGCNITNIPLLYNYSPEIKNAKIHVDQTNLNYITVKNVAINDLHSSYNEFLTAQKNLNYYNDLLLSESDRLLSLSKTSYMVGKTNITNLIFIEQSYKEIMVGYTNALATYYSSWVDFLREVNDEEIKLNE